MDNRLKNTYIWWVIHILIQVLLIYVFKFNASEKLLYLGIIGGIYILVNLFWVEFKRERLFLNGIISFISVTLVGIFLSNHLYPLIVIYMGISISIVDVLSFTRYGKKTTNAKVMSKPKYLYKLMVYGKGKGDTLYPTYGLGDCFYYSLWISGLSENTIEMLLLGFAVLIGNVINMLIVQKIHTKTNYKGIPATTVPFICVMVCYLIR